MSDINAAFVLVKQKRKKALSKVRSENGDSFGGGAKRHKPGGSARADAKAKASPSTPCRRAGPRFDHMQVWSLPAAQALMSCLQLPTATSVLEVGCGYVRRAADISVERRDSKH
jgi:hypothetical protein